MKYNFLLISFIVIIIFLGILWLINKKSNKEGLTGDSETTTSSSAISPSAVESVVTTIESSVNNALSDAGIQTIDKKQFESIMTELNTIIASEADAIKQKAEEDAKHAADIANTVDTTPSIYQANTYFQGLKFSDGFCQKYGSDPINLNSKCNALTAENCNQTDCCIFVGGTKCVAGDANGPTFTTDSNGNDIDYAYYSYKNECYGSCGKGISNAANPCSAYNDTEPGLSIHCLKRLWGDTKCPNKDFITPEKVEELKDYNKLAIKSQFKNAKAEENYINCYGENPDNWPIPCADTTDSSYGLSARCLTQLFKDAGCSNTDYITDALVKENSLEPKSAMINKFAAIKNDINNEDSLTKCYGADPLNWPDPCIDANGNEIPSTAKMFTNEVPLKCAKNRWTEILGCPNSNVIDHWYSADKNLIQLPNWTFGQYNTWLMSIKNKSLTSFKNNIPGYCYGYNPNNWPNATVVIPDPCENISWNTKIKDISNECRQRIAKNLPVNSFYQNLKTQLLSTNASNNTNNLFYNVGVADWSQSLVA